MKGEAKTGVGVGEALLTDLYQITMAQGYWKTGRGEAEAVFHLFFRKEPFHSGFAIAAGLEAVVEFLEAFRFTAGDVEFLAGLVGNDGRALFESEFLEMLRELRLTCDVEAIPEGTPVFAHEPLLRIQGPILQCQLLETALLNLVNFQTLIATKAARICLAAMGCGLTGACLKALSTPCPGFWRAGLMQRMSLKPSARPVHHLWMFLRVWRMRPASNRWTRLPLSLKRRANSKPLRLP